MDLGDQPTNILSCNNFASIAYEYFETQWQPPSSTIAKKHLQDVETAWRKHGALGVELLRKDKGTYEPSNLAKSMLYMATTMSTPISTSSPSPLENAMRNAQNANARATQANSAYNIHDPAASSPGISPQPV
ncbi:hypothetical protein DID88_004460 [Monilinia fructigena]|uniref:Uncharacterized protein n=1 Tax=Monilinia fructigena TaxID=38457 RepID=A0A395IT96_9HELO|nr:hypothetical protein DID88_004460 [Monilinia fructigena]